MCLDTDNPYAFVSSLHAVPVPLTQQPEVFKEKLEVSPATISKLEAIAPVGGTTKDAGKLSSPSSAPKETGKPTSNSFCIS